MAILGKMSSPPLTEVITGFIFEPISGLDPVTVGAFRQEYKDRYSRYELHPAIGEDQSFFLVAVPPIRTWLVSEDGVFVLQIQHDRIYINWRARGEQYPRFNDRDGSRGLLSRAMDELQQFTSLCEQHCKLRPIVRRIELAKVDCLMEQLHWKDLQDLASLLPWMASCASFSQSAEPGFTARFGERREAGMLTVALDLATLQTPNGPGRGLKLESRVMRQVTTESSDIRSEFRIANDELNSVFAGLIPESERVKRFGETVQHDPN